MSVTLCVLLWAPEGLGDELAAYEDKVLPLVAAHGGRVMQRARVSGSPSEPSEIHLLEFPSEAALDAYRNDDERAGLADDRDRAIARTQILRVELD